MPIPQAVAVLAVPTILSSLVTVLYNLADTYFVALLGDPLQNAAVTLAAPAMLAFNAISNLFGVGSSTMMSRALGRRDYERVEKASTFGSWCAILCGVLYSAACAVFQRPLLTVRRGHTYVCYDIRKLRFEPSIVREVCMVGIPASIRNLLNVTGITVLNNFTAAYGAAAVAAMGIAQKVQQVAFYIANGLSQGIMPLVSCNYASGNITRMKKGFLFAARLAVGGMLGVSVLYWAFATGPLPGS